MIVVHYLCTIFLWVVEWVWRIITKGRVSTNWIYVRNRSTRYRFVKSRKTKRDEITEEDINHKHGHRNHVPKNLTEEEKNSFQNEVEHLPIILVHGIGKASFDFHPTLREFINREEYHTHHPLVIAPDLPGYGRSKGGRLSKGHTTSDLADWLAEFLDSIHIDRAHIVGSSAGCQVALAFAKRHGRRAASLVLVSPTLGNSHTFLEYFLNTVKNAMRESHLFNICHLCMWGQMGWINFSMSALKFLGDNPLPNAKSLNTPTLIIRGSEDRIVSSSDVDFLMDQLTDKSRSKSSPKLSYKAEIAGATHNIPFERPHQFVDVLLPFISRREKESKLHSN